MKENNIKEAILPYDKSSALSIFEYSKGLLNKTLRDFISDDYTPKKGKGGLGQMVENIYFMLETNSNPNADFASAGMELKCTPLKLGKQDEYLIKERLVCNMINYCEVVKEDFEHSHFYLKCQLLLLLFYLHKSGCSSLDLEFLFVLLWKLPEKDLLIIRHDYDIIIDKIKRGEAHLLSEGDTMYLGACRKGQKGDSLMQQPYSEIGAPRRAFSLKMAYMRTILQYVVKSKQTALTNFDIHKEELVTSKELGHNSFENIILNRFTPYLGKNYIEVSNDVNVNISNNPKNKLALIASSIASHGRCSNANKSEEFVKAGIQMKTIRIMANGNNKEAMSFENIDYKEVAECEEWTESRLYELFSSRFMFVVFKEQTSNVGDYILGDVFFWTMPQSDLNLAEEYWCHIKEVILEHRISHEAWWKEGTKKKFHVRPKGLKNTDRVESFDGELVSKFCYWFNRSYIKNILEQRRLENDKQ